MKQFFINLVNWVNSVFAENMTPNEPLAPTQGPVVPNAITPALESTTEPVTVVYHPTPEAEPNNSPKPSKLDLWCKAAIAMEGANPANNNPGNIRYVEGTWMQKMAIRSNGGFCVFKDYETGYAVLQKVFTNAATGKSQIYHPAMTLYQFYEVYAPITDGNNPLHYSQVVAKEIATEYIGITNQTVISTLV